MKFYVVTTLDGRQTHIDEIQFGKISNNVKTQRGTTFYPLVDTSGKEAVLQMQHIVGMYETDKKAECQHDKMEIRYQMITQGKGKNKKEVKKFFPQCVLCGHKTHAVAKSTVPNPDEVPPVQ